MTDGKYQVMPPLSPDEEAKLRDEIAAHGVLVPVVRDQHGNILDGHHRSRIADELGVTYRVDVVQVADEQHARSLARTYNLARRHLSREQKRQLIAAEITDDPARSDREVARLMGCDHKTVGSVRREISGEVPHRSEELTPEEKARLSELETAIHTSLQHLDAAILVKLLQGTSPFEVVGWITAAWQQYELEHHNLGEEFLGPVRKTFYNQRVGEVLAWPAGWYAGEACRVPDELRDAYSRLGLTTALVAS